MPKNNKKIDLSLPFYIVNAPEQTVFNTNLVRRSLFEKLLVIKFLIEQVYHEIKERHSLEQIIINELNQNLVGLHNKLLEQQWGTSYRLYVKKFNPLEAKCVDVELAKTKEKQQSFQDRARLKQELRRLLREYLELVQNLSLFS